MKTHPDRSEAYRETLSQHAALRLGADRLRAASRPDKDGASEAEGQQQRLDDLQSFAARLYAHFRSEEREGYLGLEQHPEMALRLDHLMAEHDQLRRALDALLAEVASGLPTGDFDERIGEFLDELSRHERAENEILQECLLRDTGAGD